jgi:MarR family 2-MHQ and catechol resistance regulon transcriptional repressor
MRCNRMGTHHQGSARERRALDAYIKLLRAAGSVGGRATRHLSGARLTTSQFGVLEALHHLGPLCQKEIGRKLLLSGGNITTVVVNLERRGLVRRERDAGNRRYVTVRLTAAGRARIARAFRRHVREVVAAMGALAPRQQEALGALCRRLGLAQRG